MAQPAFSVVTAQGFNTSCFALQPAFTFGNAPRNSVLATSHADVDLGNTAGLKRIPEGASPNIKNRSWPLHLAQLLGKKAPGRFSPTRF